MLTIHVSGGELFNESDNSLHQVKPQTLILEHSLISISKWEARNHKPFLKKGDLSKSEIIDYIMQMTVNKVEDIYVYGLLTQEDYDAVSKYIDDPTTATTFGSGPEDGHNPISREIVTSEIIYYWMIAHNIPVEFEKWHINRLLTLIRICNIKNAPKKKRNNGQSAKNRTALNEARLSRYKSTG
jgi:hypothetical protein